MNIQTFAKDLVSIYSSALLSIVILFSFFLKDAKYIRLRVMILRSIFFLFLAILLSIPGLLEGFQWIEKSIWGTVFTLLVIGSLALFIASFASLTYALYKVYKISTLDIKIEKGKNSIFVPDRVETGIEEFDKALTSPDDHTVPGFMFNSTFLLRATSNSHPWIFWEKLCKNILKREQSTYMLYICLNRPADVIIDEFLWDELPKMIGDKRAYFIDGFKNVILNHQKHEKFAFNPFDINSLIRKIQKILFEEIKVSDNKKVIIVVDSLSYIYKFSGNENALRFVFYLISLSSYYKVLNLLYYRKGFLSQGEEVALENAVDSIIDFEGHDNNGKEKLRLTKIRLSKILNEEIEI